MDYLNDVELLECKFLSQGIEVLTWNCKYLLEHSNFSLYSPEMYAALHRVFVDLQKARSQYVNELRFDGNFINMK